MVRPTVFISRAQGAASPFFQAVSPWATVVGRSLVAFEAVVPEVVPDGDWLFFYSQRGIQYGWSYWRDAAVRPRIAVMGPASAEYLKRECGVEADFVGRGTPAAIATYFGAAAAGQRAVFVQAANSRQSVQRQLGPFVKTASVVVYDNVPQPASDLPLCQLLVFTSPLNVAAYFYNHTLQPDQQVVSIGETTAAALREHGVLNPTVAAAPTEPALAQACLSLINNSTQ